MPLRTPLHKCDVTYVVSLAYKGGEGVKKSRNFAYVLCARPLGHIQNHYTVTLKFSYVVLEPKSFTKDGKVLSKRSMQQEHMS